MEKLNVILRDKKKVLAKLAHVKEDYAILADEIDILREKKKKFLEQRAKTEGLKRWIAELTDFFQDANQELVEDEGMVRKYIEQIKVYEDKFKVCLKEKAEIVINRWYIKLMASGTILNVVFLLWK